MKTSSNSRFGLSVQRSSSAPQPSVHIFLQRVVRHANGMLAVTPACSSLEEIEGEIAILQRELENVLRQARQAFSAKGERAIS